jgi:hypothetical protein
MSAWKASASGSPRRRFSSGEAVRCSGSISVCAVCFSRTRAGAVETLNKVQFQRHGSQGQRHQHGGGRGADRGHQNRHGDQIGFGTPEQIGAMTGDERLEAALDRAARRLGSPSAGSQRATIAWRQQVRRPRCSTRRRQRNGDRAGRLDALSKAGAVPGSAMLASKISARDRVGGGSWGRGGRIALIRSAHGRSGPDDLADLAKRQIAPSNGLGPKRPAWQAQGGQGRSASGGLESAARGGRCFGRPFSCSRNECGCFQACARQDLETRWVGNKPSDEGF